MSRRLAAALVALAVAGSAPAAGGGEPSDAAGETPRPYAPEPPYTGVERKSFHLTMRDGVRIAVDLSLPEDLPSGARIPAVLFQTRYWRSRELVGLAALFAGADAADGRLGDVRRRIVAQGYAWLDVDVRGSGASFGVRAWDYAPDEILDGVEIVDWIVAQPWSNGRVGVAGASYGGGAAELLLSMRHPAVRAAVLMLCAFDQYADVLAPGGVTLGPWVEEWGHATAALDRNQVPWGFFAKLFLRGVRPVDGDGGESLLDAAVREHAANYDFASLAGLTYRDDVPFSPADAAPPARAEATRRAFDTLERWFGPDYLARGVDLASPHAYVPRLGPGDPPVYAYSGWLDGFYAAAAVKRFHAHARPGTKLLLGPWDHALQYVRPDAPAVPSRFDHVGELQKFFDRHLKDVDTGVDAEPPVHYFTQGDDRWKAAATWPPPAETRVLHLGPGGTLRDAPPEEGEAADVVVVDLDARAGRETRWDALAGLPVRHPYPDRAARDAALPTWTSAPLAADTEVTGHAVVTLWASSSATDGAFFAYLSDVGPDGRVTPVTEGMLRALHRGGGSTERTYRRADARPLVPGEPAELAIELAPVSWVFRSGHAIRLAVAGADRDHFAVIAPGGAPVVSFHRSAALPSRVALPVVPR